MKQMLDTVAYRISSLGLVGLVPAARIWGSLLGILFLWLLGLLYSLSPMVCFITMGCALLFMFGISWYVRRFVPEEREADIVLDRIGGVMVSLAFLPAITVKFVLFGFCLYHFWLFVSVLCQRVYVYENKTSTGAVTLSSGEIFLVALLNNGLLHCIWWLTH